MVTIDIDLSITTAHVHTMTFSNAIDTNDRDFIFSNYPDPTKGLLGGWQIQITQDATGGIGANWPSEVVNPPTINTSPNAKTLINFFTADQGITVFSLLLDLPGGGGVSFPLDFPEEQRGIVGSSTEVIDFTQSDRHAVIMELNGDIGISLTNTTTNKLQITSIKLKQDGTGGHAFTGFTQSVANEQAIIDAVNAANGPNDFVVFIVRFLDGLFTAFLEDSNVIVGGGTTTLSGLTIDVNKDWQNFAITNISAIQYTDTGAVSRGSISGDAAASAIRLATASAGKFIISDVITDIAEFTDSVGLKMLGTHVINMSDNEINTIKSLQLNNVTTFTPLAVNAIGFDLTTSAMKYNVALTTDIHRFQANGELLASISRIGSNEGQLTINAVVAEILQANDQLFLSPQVGDVSPLFDGQIWYNSTLNKFRARENGATVDLFNDVSQWASFVAVSNVDLDNNNLIKVAGIDLDGGSATIQGIANLDFIQASQSINSLTGELDYQVGASDFHRFIGGGVDIARLDDTTGLTMLGTHVINMSDNDINTIKSLQLNNVTTFTPLAVNAIGFDLTTGSMKYNVALTSSIHRFQANGELLASISRIAANEGQLSIEAVVANLLQTNEQLFFTDSSTDPTTNGEMRRNSVDVKVFSGNAVRNLSDIGTGGASQLNDLTDVTITIPDNNQELVFDEVGSIWKNQFKEGLGPLSFKVTSPQTGQFGSSEVWYTARVTATRQINFSGPTDDFFSNISPGVDLVFWMPIVMEKKFTFNALAIHAVVGTASTNQSIGFYESDPDTLEPTNLIVASNNFTLTAGDNIRTTGNISRDPGLYYLAYKQDTNPAPGSLKIRAIESDALGHILGFENGESGFDLGNTTVIGFTGEFTPNGLPTSFAASTNEAKITSQFFTIDVSGMPEVFVRITSFGL